MFPQRILVVAAALTALVAAAPTASAAQDFDSGNIAPGASWSFTFTELFPDGYRYHCHPHPWMQAMVHVVEDTDGAVTTHRVNIVEEGSSDDWGYSVEHLIVEVGDTVTWTNTGNAVHTVTKMGDGADGDDHGDHMGTGDHHDTQESPGPALLLALAAVATALLVRRR